VARRADGSGFGLRSMADLDGSLDVETAPGEGTVVALRLPLAGGSVPGHPTSSPAGEQR